VDRERKRKTVKKKKGGGEGGKRSYFLGKNRKRKKGKGGVGYPSKKKREKIKSLWGGNFFWENKKTRGEGGRESETNVRKGGKKECSFLTLPEKGGPK